MLVALKLGLTRLLCVYNVLLSKITKKFIMEEFSKKVNLRNLDRKLEEFKSKKEKSRPKQLKVKKGALRITFCARLAIKNTTQPHDRLRSS